MNRDEMIDKIMGFQDFVGMTLNSRNSIKNLTQPELQQLYNKWLNLRNMKFQPGQRPTSSKSIGMGRKPNKWLIHLAKIRNANKNLSVIEASKLASSTYKN